MGNLLCLRDLEVVITKILVLSSFIIAYFLVLKTGDKDILPLLILEYFILKNLNHFKSKK